MEIPVFSKKGKYAGRVDCIGKIGEETCIIDWKSSRSVHPSFACQLAAYANAIEENTDLKIDSTVVLQMGAQNKNGYRHIIYPDWRDHYKVFEHVRATWQYDNKKQVEEPPVLNLPDKLKL